MSVLFKNDLNDSSMSLTAVSEEEKRERGRGVMKEVCVYVSIAEFHSLEMFTGY